MHFWLFNQNILPRTLFEIKWKPNYIIIRLARWIRRWSSKQMNLLWSLQQRKQESQSTKWPWLQRRIVSTPFRTFLRVRAGFGSVVLRIFRRSLLRLDPLLLQFFLVFPFPNNKNSFRKLCFLLMKLKIVLVENKQYCFYRPTSRYVWFNHCSTN